MAKEININEIRATTCETCGRELSAEQMWLRMFQNYSDIIDRILEERRGK